MSKRIILCLDGTWNSTFQPVERDDKTTVLKPTNVLKLSRAILPMGKKKTTQLTYYDSGVGALGLYPGVSNKLLNFFDSKLGGAWGAGFEANIEQAVNFLSMNYEKGDEVFVFGFSRGAAQSRGLCQFLDWMTGLPPKKDAYYIPLFFQEYLKTQGMGDPASVRSERRGDEPFERLLPLKIKFLGVWDTVMALGSRFKAIDSTSEEKRSFHVRPLLPEIVETAYHAVAIDEVRFDFRPEIWTEYHDGQTLVQNWFAGAHGNVGGSYGNDGMANSALHWIVDAAKEAGLDVDDAFLGYYRPYPLDTLGETYTNLYKISDAIRFRYRKGTRSMTGYPERANLTLHPSTLVRLTAIPMNYDRMDQEYDPENLTDYLKQFGPDYGMYLDSIGFKEYLKSVDYKILEDVPNITLKTLSDL